MLRGCVTAHVGVFRRRETTRIRGASPLVHTVLSKRSRKMAREAVASDELGAAGAPVTDT